MQPMHPRQVPCKQSEYTREEEKQSVGETLHPALIFPQHALSNFTIELLLAANSSKESVRQIAQSGLAKTASVCMLAPPWPHRLITPGQDLTRPWPPSIHCLHWPWHLPLSLSLSLPDHQPTTNMEAQDHKREIVQKGAGLPTTTLTRCMPLSLWTSSRVAFKP